VSTAEILPQFQQNQKSKQIQALEQKEEIIIHSSLILNHQPRVSLEFDRVKEAVLILTIVTLRRAETFLKTAVGGRGWICH
jgi:hypothetical protein